MSGRELLNDVGAEPFDESVVISRSNTDGGDTSEMIEMKSGAGHQRVDLGLV
jgi:hypothetical protein